MTDPNTMGWCKTDTVQGTVQMTKADCDNIGGEWTEDKPSSGICVVATAAAPVAAPGQPSLADLRKLRDRLVERNATVGRLAEMYQREYERVAAPLVTLMEEDPVVRQIVRTIAVQPAAQFLRVAAVSATPGADDETVRAAVDRGVRQLKDNLTTLGGGEEGGEQFSNAFFAVLREVLGDLCGGG